MISNSDFEKLWFLYKTEGEPKGVSINAFCLSRGVNYNEFNKWFRKMHKAIVPLEIEGAPARDSQESVKPAEESRCIDVNPRKKGIHVFIHTSDGLQIQKKGLSYQELVKPGRETGGSMLSITGLHNFYFLPHFHDMRCKARRVSEMIRTKYHRDPLNGDVYIFMSKDQTKVKMVHYENHAFYVHEKSFVDGYKFVKLVFRDNRPVYKLEWKALVSVLESPVIKSISLQ